MKYLPKRVRGWKTGREGKGVKVTFPPPSPPPPQLFAHLKGKHLQCRLALYILDFCQNVPCIYGDHNFEGVSRCFVWGKETADTGWCVGIIISSFWQSPDLLCHLKGTCNSHFQFSRVKPKWSGECVLGSWEPHGNQDQLAWISYFYYSNRTGEYRWK